jgi:nucleotide-binding universal stress UspA family protein
MDYLVATDSVHTTAAACDYLVDRLEPDDTVVVVTVPESENRDAGDALNVANARLVGAATVEVERLDHDSAGDEPEDDTTDVDDVAGAILTAAAERDVDVVIVGTHAGSPDAGPALGSSARAVIEGATVPVVVVPTTP